jgi:hypothetical protein
MTDIRLDSGSVAERVAIFFQTNPDEVLDRSAAAAKLSIAPAAVDAMLLPAVEAGLITIGRDGDMGRVWRAGPRLKHWRALANSPPAAPDRAVSARGTRRLPPLLITDVRLGAGVAAPTGAWSSKGRTKYDHIFDALKADGESATAISRVYLGALKKAVQVYMQQRPALARASTLSVHSVDASTCGVWRKAGAMPTPVLRMKHAAA